MSEGGKEVGAVESHYWRDQGYAVVSAGDVWSISVVYSGEGQRYLPVELDPFGQHSARYSFMDSAGLRWERTNQSAPRRVIT